MTPLLAALCLGGFRCDRPPETAPAPEAPKPLGSPDLTLLLLTDPQGYLEPCGCQQRPLGGVDKLAATVKAVRAEGKPTLLMAAGTLLFGAELHGDDQEGARAQEKWKAETLTDIWSTLGMAAGAPGPLDFAQDLDQANELRERAKFPWLSANLRGSEPPLVTHTMLDAGPYRVGVVGSHGDDPGHPWPSGLTTDPFEKLKPQIASLRDQGAHLVVALHSGDRHSARQVAKAGADVVVAGGLDEPQPLPPAKHEDAWIVQAGRQGQGVLRLDLSLSGEGAWVDVSEWSVDERKTNLKREADTLAEKIAEWEQDPGVNAKDLAHQKQRLARMREEAKHLERPPHQGRWLSARWIELDPDTPSNTAIASQVDAYDKRVNQHNARTLANRKPERPAPGQPHYVGSASCGNCHTDALAWWKTTPHGNAYATLERQHKQFNLSCVGCHVTGYNQPGGSTVTHVKHLKDVGCESCHGPGSQHAAEPKREGATTLKVPERVCTECHNAEHSARFQYEGFRAMLMAPGHGMPMPDAPAE